jgi:hypothetical protein
VYVSVFVCVFFCRYNPIPIDQFQDEIYSWFYEAAPGTLEDQLLGHRFAVLFMVFAIGSQVDPALPAHNIDAETYVLPSPIFPRASNIAL